jgi:hypothetical protein
MVAMAIGEMTRMEAYCSSCGAEVEAYELIECVSCEQYFCEDCIDEGDMCFACTEADYEDGEEEDDDE